MKLIWIFLIVVFIYAVLSYLLAPKLLFKSSFGEGVYLTQPTRMDSPIWWQEIKGSDNAKFSWPIKLQGERGLLQMIVNHEEINTHIENRIEGVMGEDNRPINALHQIVRKKEHEWTQDPYVVYTKDKEQKKLYMRYSLKFPENLSELLGEEGWLAFCEYKTKSDYRLAYYIYTDQDKKLYWYVHGDNVVVDDVPYKEYWFKENRSTAVPVGQWFTVEIFWDRSVNDDGRVWLAIDGQVVIDYKGKTKKREPIHEIMLFTNYSKHPIEQWVSNIELWDDFPCGRGKSCY